MSKIDGIWPQNLREENTGGPLKFYINLNNMEEQKIMAKGKSVNRPAVTIPSVGGADAVRCGYVTLAKARAYMEGSAPKFGITLMFAKNNPAHLAALSKLKEDLIACVNEQWPDPTSRPRTPIIADQPTLGPKCPIKDADVAINDKHIPIKEANPEYAGHFIITASALESQRPHVVGPNMEAIDPNLCRSGYWYKVNLQAYAYATSGGGVTFGLNGVQLVREDEAFGGGAPPITDMFAACGGADPSLYAGNALDGGASAAEANEWLNTGDKAAANSGINMNGAPVDQHGNPVMAQPKSLI